MPSVLPVLKSTYCASLTPYLPTGIQRHYPMDDDDLYIVLIADNDKRPSYRFQFLIRYDISCRSGITVCIGTGVITLLIIMYRSWLIPGETGHKANVTVARRLSALNPPSLHVGAVHPPGKKKIKSNTKFEPREKSIQLTSNYNRGLDSLRG